jgi:hypothetical protein
MFWCLTGITAALVALMLKPGSEINQGHQHGAHPARGL